MPYLKRVLSLFLVFAVLGASPAMADEGMREILKDALYGSLTGALIGGAVMAFKDKPADHAGLVAIGGAVGALGGAAYGAYSVNRANRALAKVESGKVTLQMPTVMPELKDSPSRGQMAIIIQAEVLRGTF